MSDPIRSTACSPTAGCSRKAMHAVAAKLLTYSNVFLTFNELFRSEELDGIRFSEAGRDGLCTLFGLAADDVFKTYETLLEQLRQQEDRQ